MEIYIKIGWIFFRVVFEWLFKITKMLHAIAPIIHKIKEVLLSWIEVPVWNKYFTSSLSLTSLQVRWIADTSPTEKQVDLSSTSSCQYAKAQFASCQWWWSGWDTHSHLWVNHRFKVSKSEREMEILLRR